MSPVKIPPGETVASNAVVLFVDGHHDDYVEALRASGYHVEVVATAAEALHRGRSLHPDALIVPLLLPGIAAAQLADHIGSAATRPHTLAVVILVPTDGAGEPAGFAAADARLCRLPCPPAELVALVGRQIAARTLLGGPLPGSAS
jgi:CheY-like chemotaxis protein